MGLSFPRITMAIASIFRQVSLTSKRGLGASRRFLSTDPEIIRKTCIYDFHVSRKAKMAPFAGHSMPIVYQGQTIKVEHLQTRTAASAFDVSHMMQTRVTGKDRIAFMEKLTATDIEGLPENRCALSMFLNHSGGIIDDCIIGRRQDHLHVVSNAANAEIVWSWLNENIVGEKDVQLERLEGRGLIALQGPQASQVLQGEVDTDLSKLEFMSSLEARLHKFGSCLITRCGYTGEDGFEISIGPDMARNLMESLCQDSRVKPAGLGARDTLRLEAGLCLHGHDINTETTPIEAALSWTVSKRRRVEANFPGSEVILGQLKQGTKLKRAGLMAVGTGPPAREGSQVLDMDGTNIGYVTSGTVSPTLERNIAMAYISSETAVKFDQLVKCEIRGKRYDYKTTKMPFVRSKYYVRK